MQVGTLCQRLVFTICQSDEISRAAQVMREKHVGYLVVVEPNPVRGIPRPVGVLTDRDIVVSVVAREVDPKTVRVGDIMTPNPVLAAEWESMEAVLQKMRQFGVRRRVDTLTCSQPSARGSPPTPAMMSRDSPHGPWTLNMPQAP